MGSQFIPSWTGSVDGDGVLTLLHPEKYREYLKKFRGKDIRLTIEPFTEARTLRQNRRYFGALIREIAETTGYSVADIHEIAKAKFLKRYVEFKDGVVEIIPSTTVLTVSEFNRFMEDVEVWASELGILINDTY